MSGWAVSGTPRQAGTVKRVPFCGFQRQRELTTQGQVILRILRSLREIKRRRTDAGSESRNKVYFDYAEQQGGKDHKVGLRRWQYCPQMTLIRQDYHRLSNINGLNRLNGITALRTLVVTKFATTPAPAWYTKRNINFAPFALFAWKKELLSSGIIIISRKIRRIRRIIYIFTS